MLICLGGFVGSGRRVLAQKFAERTGFHFYDVEERKLRVPVLVRGKIAGEKKEKIDSDEVRMRWFERVVQDFPRLSKLYPDCILETVFHRQGPREFLLQEAAKSFGKVLFAWIESDEDSAGDRLWHMRDQGIIKNIDGALHTREEQQGEFEPFSLLPLTFHNTSSNEEAVGQFIELIRGKAPGINEKSRH